MIIHGPSVPLSTEFSMHYVESSSSQGTSPKCFNVLAEGGTRRWSEIDRSDIYFDYLRQSARSSRFKDPGIIASREIPLEERPAYLSNQAAPGLASRECELPPRNNAVTLRHPQPERTFPCPAWIYTGGNEMKTMLRSSHCRGYTRSYRRHI